ncbi:MAG: RagB/SusD family nutrient uptake outer membrane protein, partial [Flavobacteriaceae bacterium]
KALMYLNKVKRRGKGVDVNATDVDDLTSFTRQDVLDERGWEFVGEMKRWFDLIRTETLADALSDRDSDELPLIGDPSNQNLYYHPIPDLELQLNPNLVQNPR